MLRWNRRLAQPVLDFREQLQLAAIGRLLTEEDVMPISNQPNTGRALKPAIASALVAAVLSPAEMAAQGLPVQNGPMFPVAVWWIGALLLGLALAYGIMRNRSRTRAEKDLTGRATKKLYAEEAREERQGRV